MSDFIHQSVQRQPLKRKETSFGFLELLAEKDGQPLVEFLHFETNGRNHHHDEWEVCRVTSGGGVIVVGEERVQVQVGDTCRIPPRTDHWMEPDGHLDVMLVYLQEL